MKKLASSSPVSAGSGPVFRRCRDRVSAGLNAQIYATTRATGASERERALQDRPTVRVHDALSRGKTFCNKWFCVSELLKYSEL